MLYFRSVLPKIKRKNAQMTMLIWPFSSLNIQTFCIVPVFYLLMMNLFLLIFLTCIEPENVTIYSIIISFDLDFVLLQIFPPDRVKSSLKKIFENNVMMFEGGNMGAINGTRPDGSKDISSCQSEEFWVGVTYGLAANMIQEVGDFTTLYNKLAAL